MGWFVESMERQYQRIGSINEHHFGLGNSVISWERGKRNMESESFIACMGGSLASC